MKRGVNMFKEFLGLEQMFDRAMVDLAKNHPFILILFSFVILPACLIIAVCSGVQVLEMLIK